MADAATFSKIGAEDLNLGTGTATVDDPNGGQMTISQINLASFANGLTYSGSWDPAAVLPNSYTYTDVTVAGAVPGDVVAVSFTGAWAETLILHARVISANTVRVTISSTDTGPQNPVVGTLRVLVFHIP